MTNLRSETFSASAENVTTRVSVSGRLRRAAVRLFSPARYDRLEGDLQVAEVEIGRRVDPRSTGAFVSSLPGDLPPADSWKDAALSLLFKARGALEWGQVDEGWKLLHAARRLEIFGMDPAEVEGFGAVVRVEAGKLNLWRRKAIEELIGSAEKVRPPVANIARAALLRDEHYNNQAYKDQLIRTQNLSLAAILVAVIAGIMVLLYKRLLFLGPEPAPATFSTLAAVMLFGNLGGTISAMLRASDSMAAAARIPELTSANRVTFMRILMGGASAVVIYLALQSQLTGLFNQDFARTMTELKPQTTYVVAFVAGFSERLVLRAVEYVAGKSTTETHKAKAATPAK